MKQILMIGGDIRQKIAAVELKRQGYCTDTLIDDADDGKNIEDYSVLVLPVPTTTDKVRVNTPLMNKRELALDRIISAIGAGQILITGNYTPATDKFFDICRREDFAILNAVPTAEGAISVAMENTQTTLWGSRILVVGYGRIGKILAQRLLAFGAKVTVSARRVSDFSALCAESIPYLDTRSLCEKLRDFDIVFNTVPHMVLSAAELGSCNPDCLLVELASAPFGIDKSAAVAADLKYIYAPALPGRTAPVTAGKIVATSVANILKENSIYPA